MRATSLTSWSAEDGGFEVECARTHNSRVQRPINPNPYPEHVMYSARAHVPADALPMVISVRYDTDGVAATRDETDLVGKGDSSRTPEDSWKQADVVLSDRGVGGKLVTGRK